MPSFFRDFVFTGAQFRAVGALLLTGSLVAASAGTARSQAPERPNIVLILADDLGWGDLACQGAKDMRTPHLDRLASQGITFDRFYANSPVCSPTRASLLTGRYPDLVGVPGVIRTHPENSWGYLDPKAVLLPQALKKAGYATGMVGKWHLGLEKPNVPNERGFDHFHGFLGDMMDDYVTHRRHGNNYMRRNTKEIDPPGHATDLFTDWACDYLRSREGKRQPFFLYVAYNAPHTPIQPPDEWVRKVKERQPGIAEKRARLVALIEHMDAGVGRILSTLRETSPENTLVVFTSDNGGQVNVGASNGPLRGAKEDVYEGGIRVPMFAAWPGKIRPGRTERMGLAMDLFPTLAEAAGGRVQHPIDGVSLLDAFRGSPETGPERTVFFTRREGGPRYQGKTIHAARRGDWKLVHNSPFEPMQLFNLKTDPMEQTDQARSTPAVFRDLSAALRLQIQRSGRVPWYPPE